MIKQCYLAKPDFSKYLLYPEMIGRYTDFPEHSERRKAGLLYSYNLHIICEGEGYVFHEGKNITLRKGMGFLYPKGAYQQYGSKRIMPWDVRWVHFETEIALPFLKDVDQMRGYFFSFDMEAGLQELFDEMYALSEAFEVRNEPRISTLLYELLIKLMQNSNSLDSSLSTSVRHSIKDAADVLFNQCHQAWTLDSMSKLTGYSSYHFLRLFRTIMGKTPNRFLIDCRLARAKLLLVSTELSVAQVAIESGFVGSSYFIKVFREREGLSPQKYRHAYCTTESEND